MSEQKDLQKKKIYDLVLSFLILSKQNDSQKEKKKYDPVLEFRTLLDLVFQNLMGCDVSIFFVKDIVHVNTIFLISVGTNINFLNHKCICDREN